MGFHPKKIKKGKMLPPKKFKISLTEPKPSNPENKTITNARKTSIFEGTYR